MGALAGITGNVIVMVSNASYERPDRRPTDSDRIGMRLFRNVDYGPDSPDVAIFRNLTSAGDYYLKIIFESAPVNSGETLAADIQVSVS
jgi:hypothetical protein